MSTSIEESSKALYKFYAPFRPLNKHIREKDLEIARKFLRDFIRQYFKGATIYPSFLVGPLWKPTNTFVAADKNLTFEVWK